MIAETSLIAAKGKLFVSCLVAVGCVLADAGTTPGSYEDMTLKTILVIALVFVVRLLLKQQEEHKAERAKDAETHLTAATAREEKMLTAMQRQSDAMERVAELTQEQTDYFKTVTRGLVDERLASKKPNLP